MADQPLPAELRTDARANHERIVRAATDAFAERGLGVEMKEIAEAAGVAVGTIYRHFPSKEDLLIAIARAMLHEAGASIERCNQMSNPIEGLRVLVAGNLVGVARFGWLAGATGLRDRFQPLIRRAMHDGYLRADLDVAVASAMLEGATVPWARSAVLAGREPEQAADAIMQVFLEGAATEPRQAVSVIRPKLRQLK
jgi:AcrR family transcriptional regulator